MDELKDGNEKSALKTRATRLVEEASTLVEGFGHSPLSAVEQTHFAAKVYGYLRQQVTGKKARLANIGPLEISFGILETRGKHNFLRYLVQPFVKTLLEAQLSARAYAPPGLECTLTNGKSELVHLYQEESLLKAGEVMKNCLNKASHVSERLEEKQRERAYAVYAVRPKRSLRDESAISYSSIMQVDRAHEEIVDLEETYNGKII